MAIRLFRPSDLPAVVSLSASCARAEADFVLNPMWESEAEFHAEFERHGISPEEHLLVDDLGEGEVVGLSGFLRPYGSQAGGIFCPVVERSHRGQGSGGELLRAALELGKQQLGLSLATAGIGTRNRGGYHLLTAHGFRPVRQHFLMRCESRPEVAAMPEGLTVEPASAGDLEAILAIYESCGFEARTPEQMQRIFENGRHAHAVARRDGEVVAFSELETHWPTRSWVAYVGVEPGLRDRGVGTSLVGWSVAAAFDRGVTQALLLLSPANRTAVRAYEKVGFRRARLFDVLEKSL
ncbi:MAG: GNAT family N-acetyltransferase [Myxococcota bacterium]|nr:GNAT family N-acetyltransferase [Myxococcota bacterium]